MPQARPCTALAIAAPRKAASRMACSGVNTPAQASAEYSPRLRPAAASGRMPSAASAVVTPQAKATMQGWV